LREIQGIIGVSTTQAEIGTAYKLIKDTKSLNRKALPVELTRCHVGCFLGLEFTFDFTFMNRKIDVHVLNDQLKFSQHQELD